MRFAFFAGSILITLLTSLTAHATSRVEKTFGLGVDLYSGAEASYVSPELAPALHLGANLIFKGINLTNHFELSYLSGGQNFGGKHGAYGGVVGTYDFGFRFNLAKDELQPFIQAGPSIGLFGVMLSAGSSTVSKNQTAFKYGYSIGTGFDWIRSGMRGEGNGWGLGVSYFSFMKSPSVFEFPNASLGAHGVKIEFRRVFGDSDR